ncbi:MAG TPA: nucleotidyltransferase family protein [Nitrosomonas mobilis]|nr:nucleotidyltransferase family protein [Nitrosomonas mobilis]
MTDRRLNAHHQLLVRALRDPPSLCNISNQDWELLLRLVRRARLLGFLAVELGNAGLLDKIPVRIANHLRSGLIQARKYQQLARWELDRVRWALGEDRGPIIVLKGMAYLLAGLPHAAGRVFADLDLLVLAENLQPIESALLAKGWQHHELSAYDEHYYRAWTHEIPALIHRERETEVDIHHTLTSPIGRLQLEAAPFREAAVRLPELGIYVLSPPDMVLHCAVNLFQNNELADDMRHLLDLHGMLQHFSSDQPLFLDNLITRANQLRLGRPLFYGLYFCRLLLRTPVPNTLMTRLEQRPGWLALKVMQLCVPLALLPLHPDLPCRGAKLARWWLYWRSHWLRMPLHVLVPHLAYKFYLSVFPSKAANTASSRVTAKTK